MNPNNDPQASFVHCSVRARLKCFQRHNTLRTTAKFPVPSAQALNLDTKASREKAPSTLVLDLPLRVVRTAVPPMESGNITSDDELTASETGSFGPESDLVVISSDHDHTYTVHNTTRKYSSKQHPAVSSDHAKCRQNMSNTLSIANSTERYEPPAIDHQTLATKTCHLGDPADEKSRLSAKVKDRSSEAAVRQRQKAAADRYAPVDRQRRNNRTIQLHTSAIPQTNEPSNDQQKHSTDNVVNHVIAGLCEESVTRQLDNISHRLRTKSAVELPAVITSTGANERKNHITDIRSDPGEEEMTDSASTHDLDPLLAPQQQHHVTTRRDSLSPDLDSPSSKFISALSDEQIANPKSRRRKQQRRLTRLQKWPENETGSDSDQQKTHSDATSSTTKMEDINMHPKEDPGDPVEVQVECSDEEEYEYDAEWTPPPNSSTTSRKTRAAKPAPSTQQQIGECCRDNCIEIVGFKRTNDEKKTFSRLSLEEKKAKAASMKGENRRYYLGNIRVCAAFVYISLGLDESWKPRQYKKPVSISSQLSKLMTEKAGGCGKEQKVKTETGRFRSEDIGTAKKSDKRELAVPREQHFRPLTHKEPDEANNDCNEAKKTSHATATSSVIAYLKDLEVSRGEQRDDGSNQVCLPYWEKYAVFRAYIAKCHESEQESGLLRQCSYSHFMRLWKTHMVHLTIWADHDDIKSKRKRSRTARKDTKDAAAEVCTPKRAVRRRRDDDEDDGEIHSPKSFSPRMRTKLDAELNMDSMCEELTPANYTVVDDGQGNDVAMNKGKVFARSKKRAKYEMKGRASSSKCNLTQRLNRCAVSDGDHVTGSQHIVDRVRELDEVLKKNHVYDMLPQDDVQVVRRALEILTSFE